MAHIHFHILTKDPKRPEIMSPLLLFGSPCYNLYTTLTIEKGYINAHCIELENKILGNFNDKKSKKRLSVIAEEKKKHF